MAERNATRDAACAAAGQLASRGERPTIHAVRAMLDGKGGQAAIQAGIQDWLVATGELYAFPGYPEALRESFIALWQAAVTAADARWDAERAPLNARVAEVVAERDTALADIQALTAERVALSAEVASLQAAIGVLTDDLERAQIVARETAAHLQDAEERLALARSALDAETAARASAEQALETATAALTDLQGAFDAQQVALRVATSRAALLEQTATDATATLTHTRGDLAAAHQRIAALETQLAENQKTLGSLGETLANEQTGRAADTEHWLARLRDAKDDLTNAIAREKSAQAQLARLWSEVERARGLQSAAEARARAAEQRLADQCDD